VGAALSACRKTESDGLASPMPAHEQECGAGKIQVLVTGSDSGLTTGLVEAGATGASGRGRCPMKREPDLVGTHLNGAAAGSFQDERFVKTASATLD
jgi:hypothetical protein